MSEPNKDSDPNLDDKSDDKDKKTDEDNGADKDMVVKYSPEQLTEKLVHTADEAKKMRLQRNDARKELDKMKGEKREQERARLEQEGKFKELNESLKKENEELTGLNKKKDETYATERVISIVREEAVKMGVSDVTDLQDLITLSPWNELEVDEKFNPKREDVKKMLSEQKKTRPRLFGNKKLNLADGNPPPNSGQKPGDQAQYEKELSATTSQAQFDAVRKKYGRVGM